MIFTVISKEAPMYGRGPRLGDDWFEVSLIPETLAVTTLGSKDVGDRVNIETDILARHVARLMQFERSQS